MRGCTCELYGPDLHGKPWAPCYRADLIEHGRVSEAAIRASRSTATVPDPAKKLHDPEWEALIAEYRGPVRCQEWLAQLQVSSWFANVDAICPRCSQREVRLELTRGEQIEHLHTCRCDITDPQELARRAEVDARAEETRARLERIDLERLVAAGQVSVLRLDAEICATAMGGTCEDPYQARPECRHCLISKSSLKRAREWEKKRRRENGKRDTA